MTNAALNGQSSSALAEASCVAVTKTVSMCVIHTVLKYACASICPVMEVVASQCAGPLCWIPDGLIAGVTSACKASDCYLMPVRLRDLLCGFHAFAAWQVVQELCGRPEAAGRQPGCAPVLRDWRLGRRPLHLRSSRAAAGARPGSHDHQHSCSSRYLDIPPLMVMSTP